MITRHVRAATVMFGEEEQDAVRRVLASGQVVQGREVEAFEQEFAAVVDGRDCVAVNSGTSALHLALLAAGIGVGDEVVVPSFSFAATANAVALTGARPVFADIDPVTYCLDPASVEAAVTPRTAAVMPVHLFGHPADMSRLQRVAERHGLLLVEDAAQAHGAVVEGQAAGAAGHVSGFSFYATKNMTCGEGGMVVSADEAVLRRVRLLRNQGMERQYHNELVGLNNRLTEPAAAIGRVQLGKLAGWNTRRREIAATYDALLRGLVTLPAVRQDVVPVFHQYTIRVEQRDAVLESLLGRGVEARVFYPVPIHRLAPYRTDDALHETELAAQEVISLPIRPGMDDDDVSYVAEQVHLVVSEVS